MRNVELWNCIPGMSNPALPFLNTDVPYFVPTVAVTALLYLWSSLDGAVVRCSTPTRTTFMAATGRGN